MSSTARLSAPDQCPIHSPAQPGKSHMGQRRLQENGIKPGPGQPAREESEEEEKGEREEA